MSTPDSPTDSIVSDVDYGADSFPNPETAPNITYNPRMEELRALAAHHETTTEYGSPSYISEYKSRSADRTKTAVDDEFSSDDDEHIGQALGRLETDEFVCVDRMMGRDGSHSYCCRLFVPTEYARIAFAWARLLEPAESGREPDFHTLQIPTWEDTRIRVLPDEGVTVVLGSDYTGEAKKSFLRLFMYRTKQRGGLGLHAGTKRVTVETDDGLVDREQVFLGLSGTGKSTLTGHGFWLDEPERAEMLQDDVCALHDDGSVTGSEGGGLYIKTDGLDDTHQPTLYRAATHPEAVLENVHVGEGGAVDFDNDDLTANGRAVVRRDDVSSAADGIDCDEADQLFFITRHPLVPPIARLSPEQAAAAFMLGESIETSAGDPERAGEPVRVVGTNPFIIGSEGEEGNRFYDLIVDNDIECFVINTGRVGPVDEDVGVEDTVAILTAAARREIEWTTNDQLGVDVPVVVPGIDVRRFLDAEQWAASTDALDAVRAEREAYLTAFADLNERIRTAVY
ncbi:phosphoenolpyruvate carboxykinase [Haloferacaceae archaeon DSL9]